MEQVLDNSSLHLGPRSFGWLSTTGRSFFLRRLRDIELLTDGVLGALYLMGLGRIHFLRADRIGVARVLSMADAADLQSVREFMVADLALLDHLAGNSKPAEELLTTYSHEIDSTNNDPRTRLLWFLRHR